MTSFVHAEEVQVADALELTARHAVDSVLSEFRSLELSRVAVVEVVDDELAAVPVADPVWRACQSMSPDRSCQGGGGGSIHTKVTSPDQDVDAALNDRLQRREERTGLVTSRDNLGVRAGRAL